MGVPNLRWWLSCRSDPGPFIRCTSTRWWQFPECTCQNSSKCSSHILGAMNSGVPITLANDLFHSVLANKPKSATVVPVMKMLSHWYNKTNWTSLNDKFIIENFVFLVYLQITMDDVWCPIEWRKYQRPFRIWRHQSTFTLILLKRLEDQFYQTETDFTEKWWNEKKN